MNTREYLNQINDVESSIRKLTLKIAHFDSMVNDMKLGYDSDRVQTSKVDMDPAYAQYLGMKLDAERELQELVKNYSYVYNQVELTSNQVGGVESDVLYMKHISGMFITQIAEKLNYSYDGIRKIYERGVEKVEEILIKTGEIVPTSHNESQVLPPL